MLLKISCPPSLTCEQGRRKGLPKKDAAKLEQFWKAEQKRKKWALPTTTTNELLLLRRP